MHGETVEFLRSLFHIHVHVPLPLGNSPFAVKYIIGPLFYLTTVTSHFPLAHLTPKTSTCNKQCVFQWEACASQYQTFLAISLQTVTTQHYLKHDKLDHTGRTLNKLEQQQALSCTACLHTKWPECTHNTRCLMKQYSCNNHCALEDYWV